ncbi:MAG: cytochrome C oxidase subunit IV family protein [Leptospiraceae bacterium]|nr:cytochrome C oxidase subunit IV family protein [Leptospiraceae bacterium]MCB1168645.1 cytochrome C oxidase subunit IV family protein [Leptospiraceae bacterium]MCB1306494.1 cytochrome C oxidase subunit IV family protein [Leptospiraceae bacterium]
MHIPDQESRGHVSPTKTYIFAGLTLYILTIITVAVSYWDSGSMLVNVLIAMAIATGKAFVVLWYFMHMKYEDKIVWLYGIWYPIILFAILIGSMFLDVFNRVKVGPDAIESQPAQESMLLHEQRQSHTLFVGR